MRRIRQHLTYANVMVTILAFIVLTGGAAVALEGQSRVFTDDVANDNVPASGGNPAGGLAAADLRPSSVGSSEVANNGVTRADIAANALAASPWRRVGTAGQPAFNENDDCRWTNFDLVHSTAAFVRDATGFVHLKGTVKPLDQSSAGSCDFGGGPAATNHLIFVLPPGYRPPKREAMAVLLGRGAANPEVSTVSIDGPAISPLPAGAVAADRDQLGGDVYLTLDGISFRCAPSGSNGCP
jgi:hypothetical protein